jgi:hypothetical protein
MPQDLRQIASTTSEYVEIARVGITHQLLLNLKRQSLHPAPHIRVAGRDPNPTSRRNGNQDRSAFSVAEITADGVFAPIRTRAPFISTKIAPCSGSLVGANFVIGGRGAFSTTTSAKAAVLAAARASRRH